MKFRGLMKYLGVDRSGQKDKNLEVFAGVFSKNESDINLNKNLTAMLEKKDTLSILKGKLIKHILISDEYKYGLNDAEIQTVALYEFLRQYENIELVVVGYELPEEVISNLKRMLKDIPEIKSDIEAKIMYDISCAANGMALNRYNHYKRLEKSNLDENKTNYDHELIILRDPMFYRGQMK